MASIIAKTLAGLVLRSIAFLLGLLVLGVYCAVAYFEGLVMRRVSDSKKDERRMASADIWDLSNNPLPNFTHQFYKPEEGPTLHFVEGGSDASDAELVVFLHGFPDSWFTWQHQLSSPAIQQKAHMVAVDLPGYGGSEACSETSATAILEVLTSFIIQMMHNQNKTKCVLVGHDWGAVIGFRLASEAGFLFKHVILLNGTHPVIFQANATRAVKSFVKIMGHYFKQPKQTALLKHAYRAIYPVANQILRSHYIFAFNLPLPLAQLLPTAGDYWFLRLLARLSKSGSENLFLASSLGPGHDEIEGYPKGVIQDYRDGRKVENMLALYRYGVAYKKWRKSMAIAVMEARAGGSIIEHIPGSLLCSATIVYGAKDTAFHRPICYDGLDEYLTCADSSLINFSTMGHWTMVASPGRDAVNEIIQWVIDEGNLKQKVTAWYPGAKFELQK